VPDPKKSSPEQGKIEKGPIETPEPSEEARLELAALAAMLKTPPESEPESKEEEESDGTDHPLPESST